MPGGLRGALREDDADGDRAGRIGGRRARRLHRGDETQERRRRQPRRRRLARRARRVGELEVGAQRRQSGRHDRPVSGRRRDRVVGQAVQSGQRGGGLGRAAGRQLRMSPQDREAQCAQPHRSGRRDAGQGGARQVDDRGPRAVADEGLDQAVGVGKVVRRDHYGVGGRGRVRSRGQSGGRGGRRGRGQRHEQGEQGDAQAAAARLKPRPGVDASGRGLREYRTVQGTMVDFPTMLGSAPGARQTTHDFAALLTFWYRTGSVLLITFEAAVSEHALRIVVLVKQVPDTANVTGEAMKDDGTVNRAALPAIFNPEDLNALEVALDSTTATAAA